MTIHYQGHGVTLHHGDCLDVLRTLPDASVDSVVTDPPYGLEFMGKDWDAPWKASSVGRGVRVESERAAEMTERGKGHSTPGGPFLAARVDSTRVAGKPFQDWCEAWATECLRVLKPGGHLLAFGGTRTWHRLACAVEDAGFEVRDSIARFHSIDMNNAAQLMKVWQEWTERVPSAGLRFRELGGSSAGDRVLLEPSHDESPARALIADLCSSGHPPTPAETWPSVASNVGAGSTASSALVTIAGASPESRGQQPGTTGSSAPSDAPEWLAASREATTRAAEALRIWLGAKPSSRPGATDALCAALSNALKHITCAHSETFRSYDTTWQTVCVSATTATTTASTAANLLAFTADTLAGLDPEEVMPLEADSGPLAWVYGSGFPRLKSLDVSKAIDKRREEDRAPIDAVRSWLNARRLDAGLTHDAVNKHFGHASNGGGSSSAWMTNPTIRSLPTWDQWQELKSLFGFGDDMDAEVWRLNGRKGAPGEAWDARVITGMHHQGNAIGNYELKHGVGKGRTANERRDAPATPAAERWQGWGTALKPAFEPVVVARKPIQGTVAANVLAWGTGALNVDGCRIGEDGGTAGAGVGPQGDVYGDGLNGTFGKPVPGLGRWPANVVLDCEMAEALDEQSGESTSQGGSRTASRGATQGASNGGMQGGYNLGAGGDYQPYGDSGGASRFFYVAKADASERPRLPKRSLRLRDDLTPEQVDHVRARLVEAGVQVD